ncbi:MAG: rod shape-determining protein MreC [Thermoleophilia bacterium]|nr:rod shape-determining protein MreC [Thermoleophilia bacterium]
MRFTLPSPPQRRPRATNSTGAGSGSSSAKYMSRASRTRTSRSSGSIFPRRRRPAPLVRRVVLAALLAASLGLITGTYRGGVVLSGAQMAVLDVVAPIQRGMSRAWDPIAGAADWTGRLFTATNENPTLERENAELRTKLNIAEGNGDTIADLQADLGYKDRGSYPNDYKTVYGTVMSRASGVVDKNIIIDLGTDHGIAENDPVLTRDGLIGRVLRVSSNTATVALIINESETVTATVSGTTAEGSLRTVSTEGSPVMGLDFVSLKSDVTKGDLVVTNGFVTNDELRSLYPRGLNIGRVSSVGKSPGDVYQKIQVTPFADFEGIRGVFVLVPEGKRTTFEVPPAVTPTSSRPSTDRRVDKAVTAPVKTAKRIKLDAAEAKAKAAAAKAAGSDAAE